MEIIATFAIVLGLLLIWFGNWINDAGPIILGTFALMFGILFIICRFLADWLDTLPDSDRGPRGPY